MACSRRQHLSRRIRPWSAIDADGLRVIAEIPVQESGWHQGMIFGPDSKTLFAVNHGAGTVSVVDAEENRVIDRLVVGDGPSNIIALG